MKNYTKELVELLEELINCPHSLDIATIPKDGIDKNPKQVVLQYSIGFIRIQKAKELINKIKKC
jgi:hypothetical protein